MFFTERLSIPNGIAKVPALLWCANKQTIKIFALKTDKRPTEKQHFSTLRFLMCMKQVVYAWDQLILILKILLRWKSL
jgi:hypothetical protein